jgi:hypothetical protein
MIKASDILFLVNKFIRACAHIKKGTIDMVLISLYCKHALQIQIHASNIVVLTHLVILWQRIRNFENSDLAQYSGLHSVRTIKHENERLITSSPSFSFSATFTRCTILSFFSFSPSNLHNHHHRNKNDRLCITINWAHGLKQMCRIY